MHKMRLRAGGLAAYAFTHRPDHIANIAVVLPGLPYTPGLPPTGHYLFTLGYDVVQPQYTGTYDSDGVFSPATAIATVDRLHDLLTAPSLINHRTARHVTVEPGITCAAAHSFGTWVLANAFLTGLRPHVLLLLSPYLGVGRDLAAAGSRIDLRWQVDQLRHALPHTFRPPSYQDWEAFYTTGVFPWPALQPGDRSHIIGVTGADDEGLDPHQTRQRFDWFVHRHGDAVASHAFFVVPSAGHDEMGLLTEPVLRELGTRLPASSHGP